MFEDTNPNTPVENKAEDSQSTSPENIKAREQTQPQQDQNTASTPEASATPDQQQTQPPQPVAPREQPIKTTQDERIWAALGYIAFLGVISLAMKPKSDFCRKHSAQGLILFVIWFIGLILLALPSFISIIGLLVILLITAVAIYGIVRSIQSYEMNLPVLSSLAGKIPTEAIIGGITGKTPQPTDKPVSPETPAPTETPTEPPAETPTEPPAETPTENRPDDRNPQTPQQ